jgi:hypothetical protein
MHVVSIMYPRENAQSSFDMEHYLSVHLKLGFRLMKKHFGVVPEKALVQHSTRGMDNSPRSARYLTICWVCFKSRADADLFVDVFGIEEVAQALTTDWSNYCPLPPDIVIGEVMELSGEEVVTDADAVLQRLGIALTT